MSVNVIHVMFKLQENIYHLFILSPKSFIYNLNPGSVKTMVIVLQPNTVNKEVVSQLFQIRSNYIRLAQFECALDENVKRSLLHRQHRLQLPHSNNDVLLSLVIQR